MALYRIDDVSVNTDETRLVRMMSILSKIDSDAHFMLAVSPVVFDMSDREGTGRERPFPSILNAYSDASVFFSGSKLGLPNWLNRVSASFNFVEVASHGLIHVDHRLLAPEVQSFSIAVSCSLVGSKIFVPPFNKWSPAMREFCTENGFDLVVWESGWKHLKYQPLTIERESKYYFHTHDFSDSEFEQRLSSV